MRVAGKIFTLLCFIFPKLLSAESIRAEDFAVFNYILEGFQSTQRNQWGQLTIKNSNLVLISDVSVLPFSPEGLQKSLQSRSFMISNPQNFKEVVQDFKRRNISPVSLRSFFPDPYPNRCYDNEKSNEPLFVVSAQSRIAQFFPAPGEMLPFSSALPAVAGVLRLSVPGYSNDHTKAFIYYEYLMRPLGDSQAEFALLEKKSYGDGWNSYHTRAWNPDFVGMPSSKDLQITPEDVDVLRAAIAYVMSTGKGKNVTISDTTGSPVSSEVWYDPDHNPPDIRDSAIVQFARRNKQSVKINNDLSINGIRFLKDNEFKNLAERNEKFPRILSATLPGFNENNTTAVVSIRDGEKEYACFLEKTSAGWRVTWNHEIEYTIVF